jgi:hypothetical protein
MVGIQAPEYPNPVTRHALTCRLGSPVGVLGCAPLQRRACPLQDLTNVGACSTMPLSALSSWLAVAPTRTKGACPWLTSPLPPFRSPRPQWARPSAFSSAPPSQTSKPSVMCCRSASSPSCADCAPRLASVCSPSISGGARARRRGSSGRRCASASTSSSAAGQGAGHVVDLVGRVPMPARSEILDTLAASQE